ncbi:unnamed protein product [Protopolystoma xenopodis]|uniref:Uncharacterized protein n=1 Tax=Protopolystoma xenopodis TaxID=117903 RepID=A0A3S5B122_9PLAT|nr:unnamed protein product [Protopolystoma xenopodis]
MKCYYGKPEENRRGKKNVESCEKVVGSPFYNPDESVLSFRLYHRKRHRQKANSYGMYFCSDDVCFGDRDDSLEQVHLSRRTGSRGLLYTIQRS